MASALINPDFHQLLESEGLLDIDTAFAHPRAEEVKALLAVRQTFRISTAEGTVLYLKRYTEPEPDRFLDLLGARRFPSPASREFTVLQRLAELSVPAPVPLACLEESRHRRVQRAVLVTLGLPPAANLENFLRNPGLSPARRKRLARELGRITRTMHEGGVNHRDFYFVHLLVGDGDRIFVTDLNRADLRRRVGRRWRVKDLAALLHSAPPGVTTREMVLFARTYLDSPLRQHRRFLDAVRKKAARMKALTLKRIAQGRPNYHAAQ